MDTQMVQEQLSMLTEINIKEIFRMDFDQVDIFYMLDGDGRYVFSS